MQAGLRALCMQIPPCCIVTHSSPALLENITACEAHGWSAAALSALVSSLKVAMFSQTALSNESCHEIKAVLM
jgi:hypothetical protein